jgi:hypothetical protein
MAEWPIETAVAELPSRELRHQNDGRIAQVRPGDRMAAVSPGPASRPERRRVVPGTPLTGWLTDAMMLPAGTLSAPEGMSHPRIDPYTAPAAKRRAIHHPAGTPALGRQPATAQRHHLDAAGAEAVVRPGRAVATLAVTPGRTVPMPDAGPATRSSR